VQRQYPCIAMCMVLILGFTSSWMVNHVCSTHVPACPAYCSSMWGHIACGGCCFSASCAVHTQVSGLCIRMERYAEQDSYASRLAVSVHDFEVRVPGCTQNTLTGCDLVVWLQSILQLTETQYECKWQNFRQLKFQRHGTAWVCCHVDGSACVDLQVRDCTVAKDARSPWRRVLGHHATLRAPRDPAACIFQVSTLSARIASRLLHCAQHCRRVRSDSAAIIQGHASPGFCSRACLSGASVRQCHFCRCGQHVCQCVYKDVKVHICMPNRMYTAEQHPHAFLDRQLSCAPIPVWCTAAHCSCRWQPSITVNRIRVYIWHCRQRLLQSCQSRAPLRNWTSPSGCCRCGCALCFWSCSASCNMERAAAKTPLPRPEPEHLIPA
jgi:hypothetical protein